MPGLLLENLHTGGALAQLWPAGDADQVLSLASVDGGSTQLEADWALQLDLLFCNLLFKILQFQLQLHGVIAKGSLQFNHLLTYPLGFQSCLPQFLPYVHQLILFQGVELLLGIYLE